MLLQDSWYNKVYEQIISLRKCVQIVIAIGEEVEKYDNK